MAKKTTTGSSTGRSRGQGASPEIKSTTPVRNSPIPKVAAPVRQVTQDDIARRAYEIHLSGQGGTDVENWLRAERELLSA